MKSGPTRTTPPSSCRRWPMSKDQLGRVRRRLDRRQYALTVVNWDFTNVQLQGIGYIAGGNQGDTIHRRRRQRHDRRQRRSATALEGRGGRATPSSMADPTEQTTASTPSTAGRVEDKLIANGAGATIELGAMTGVEELSTGGFANVALVMSTANDTLDLRTMTVTGKFAVFALNGGDDTFYGTAGADFVDGGAGNDFIDTGDGDDVIQLSFGAGWDDIRGAAPVTTRSSRPAAACTGALQLPGNRGGRGQRLGQYPDPRNLW
ncbi:hypothetical protein ACRAWD_16535 [Caulobacter segnis]